MRPSSGSSLVALALAIFLGLAALGYLLGQAAVQVKEYERTVMAKGLSEREYPADIVIWPVAFTVTGDDLGQVLMAADSRIERVAVHVAQPGEPTRVLCAKDVVQPRWKPEGAAPGAGVTRVLENVAVVTCGPIVGFQEGIIDMSGPIAPYW